MFTHHTFIFAEHHVALEATVRNHWATREEQLAMLYKAALFNLDKNMAAFSNPKSQLILLSLLQDPEVAVSVATDAESGVYVQLARLKSHAQGKAPLMTVGQKWAAENPPSAGSAPTKLW
jgi:hypothetical protein